MAAVSARYISVQYQCLCILCLYINNIGNNRSILHLATKGDLFVTFISTIPEIIMLEMNFRRKYRRVICVYINYMANILNILHLGSIVVLCHIYINNSLNIIIRNIELCTQKCLFICVCPSIIWTIFHFFLLTAILGLLSHLCQ